MEEWDPFLILWLWQPEGSWESKVREKCARALCSQPLPPSDGEEATECSHLLSSDRRAWAGDRRIHALVVIEHHLKLFLHVVIGLACVYTSQPSDSSWHSECEMAIWRHGFPSSHTAPPVTLCFVQLTLGALAEALSPSAGRLDTSKEVVITEAGNGS